MLKLTVSKLKTAKRNRRLQGEYACSDEMIGNPRIDVDITKRKHEYFRSEIYNV